MQRSPVVRKATPKMATKSLQKRRSALAESQGWKCYWCETEMTPTKSETTGSGPDSMLTLDHLFGRGDPRRVYHDDDGIIRYVAACRRCNEGRGKVHCREIRARFV